MFSLLDYLFSIFGGYGKDRLIKKRRGLIKRFYGDRNLTGPLYIYFLPQSTFDSKFLTNRYVLKKYRSVQYRISTSTISPNPQVTRNLFRKILKDAMNQAKDAIKQGRKVYVLGLSIGVIPAVSLANKVRVDKLTILFGGSDIAACVKEGIVTKNL
jgi:hypothetical protein